VCSQLQWQYLSRTTGLVIERCMRSRTSNYLKLALTAAVLLSDPIVSVTETGFELAGRTPVASALNV